jgi:hypothetical protein
MTWSLHHLGRAARMNAVASALVCSASTLAQCPAPGDCREPHENPGCIMPQCCEIVCAINPLCCEMAWGQDCVDIALKECEDINCPAAGACDDPHATPGCTDFACCDFVVTIDPWCTFASWDEFCARAAASYCGVARCEISTDGIPDEEEPCYRRLNDGWAAGAEHPRIDLACGTALRGKVVDGGPRDLEWFVLDAPQRRRVRATLEAEFPIELQYLIGGSEGPNETRWLMSPGLCAGEVRVNFLVSEGVGTLILGAGDTDRSWRTGLDCDEIDPNNPPDPEAPAPVQVVGVRWRLRVDCIPVADINGDGFVGAADLGTLLSAWGPIDRGAIIDPLAPDADLNGDGAVGPADLALLLGTW